MYDLFLTNIAQKTLYLITVLTTKTGDFPRVVINQSASYFHAFVIMAGNHIAAEKAARDTKKPDR